MTEQHPNYEAFFQAGLNNGSVSPHPWQVQLASGDEPENRLIRIPTGMGKTLGVLTTWAWHRVHNDNTAWPRRLVWCLPMRTLVEQTVREAEQLLENLGLADRVSVRTLMGGSDEQNWYQDPAACQILVGTQDMLLSRALNRGYAMGRAAWPRAFGLLNTDALWVMDEVQLMDVGLATSGQLQAFARDWMETQPDLQRFTWWMSATLQPDWLDSPETSPWLEPLRSQQLSVNPNERHGPQWEAQKPVTRHAAPSEEWAEQILQRHTNHDPDPHTGRQTLVVVNTVKQACELHRQIQKQASDEFTESTELCLIHSRFRPAERASWTDQFLSRSTLSATTNRLIIATQVVEAGVDISASCLITELAPWPSLVQRFGRAARYGGTAEVVVLDQELNDEKKVLPYTLHELQAARQAIDALDDVSIGSLEDFEATQSAATIETLFPYDPIHVLQQNEFAELFDTSPDLCGNDVDVSRFIRSGDDRSLQVFWRETSDNVQDQPLPQRQELCNIPVADARSWLGRNHIDRHDIHTWDYVDGHWLPAERHQLRPGQVLMVSTTAGGYDSATGFTGSKPSSKSPVHSVWQDKQAAAGLVSEYVESTEFPSIVPVWKTIATHGQEASQLALQLADKCDIPDDYRPLLDLTLRLHDWGKAHPAFAHGTYRVTPGQSDLAKAPSAAWRNLSQLYNTPETGHRRGFRHELVSCLATLELLRGANPLHPAVLGNYQQLLEATGTASEATPEHWHDHPLALELSELTALHVNLVLYLIAAHHGKVRCSLQAVPIDQDFPFDDPQYMGEGLPIRGVRQNDVVPPVSLICHGTTFDTPKIDVDLSPAALGISARYGASWTERVQSLLTHLGPFRLAQLEAIVRAADGRASDDTQSPGSDPDPLLADVTLSVPAESPHTSSETDSIEEACHV